MAFAITRDKRASKCVAGAAPAALFGLAEIAGIMSQRGGQAGVNRSLDGEAGVMAAGTLEEAARAPCPRRRVRG